MQNPIAEPLKLQSTSLLVWPKRWIRCAGALLLLVAFSKWLSIWEGAEVLAAVDPLTGIRYGTLLTVALFLELCMAYAAFEFPLGWGTLYGIGWLGSGFAGYRLARLHGDIEALLQMPWTLFGMVAVGKGSGRIFGVDDSGVFAGRGSLCLAPKIAA